MKMSTRALIGFLLWTIIVISASPTSPSPASASVSVGGLCIQQSNLQNIQTILDHHKKEYSAVHSNVCVLTNRQPSNISSTNQNEDNKILSAWVDLLQLHLSVQDLFDNYTAWLEDSTTQKNLRLHDVDKDESDFKNIVFLLWQQLQESNKRIEKLEERSVLPPDKRETAFGMKTDSLNKIHDSPKSKQEMADDKTNSKSNDIYYKLKNKSNIFPNDLQYLQGQINVLNATVVSLVTQMTRMETEMSSLRKMENAESFLDELASQPQRITNETCNGRRRHLVGSSCYFIPQVYESEQMSTWWDSRYFCKQPEVLGPEGDLAVIDSKQEMDAIRAMLTNHFGGIEAFWIGATDIDHEGQWVWAPNEAPLSSGATFWAEPPRPDTLTNCAAMEEGYRWIPEPCYYERVPLCELQL